MSKYIGKTYGQLKVVGTGKPIITKGGYKYKNLICQCSCGKVTQARSGDLTLGKKVSCGCHNEKQKNKLKKSLIGKRYGKLKVIERLKNNKSYRRTVYKVLCDCGKTSVVSSSNLISNAQQTCGKCGLYRNGVMTSRIALELHKIIGEGEHNYYTGVVLNKRNINVDIALIEDKIAIEYDGAYWHKNKKEWDNQQTFALINNGWKVLRIKSSRNLPSKDELFLILSYLKSTKPQVVNLYLE